MFFAFSEFVGLRTESHSGRGPPQVDFNSDFLNLGGLFFELREKSFHSFLLLGDGCVLFCYSLVQLSNSRFLFLNFLVLFDQNSQSEAESL